jgi:8-oxo-dGTP pyrophosphatase MutT (NUDIX family)
VNEAGTWGTFGGRVEADEEPSRAAEREFREETGYDGSIDLVPLDRFTQPTFSYQNYLGLMPEEFVPQLNWEPDDCQ